MALDDMCLRRFLGAITLLLTISATSDAREQHSVSTDSDFESFYHQVAGINYYLEKRGSGSYLVMVTSGQGDSGAYRFLADTLAEKYTVITFDPPGFSRSSPPPSWDNMSSALLGDQVAALVKSLGIDKATYYGSSSGGTTVLSLIADHPELVHSAVIHEPAAAAEIRGFTFVFPKVMGLKSFFGGGVTEEERRNLYGDGESLMISDRNAYRKLGEAHLQRRINNKAIWYEHYAKPDIPCCNRLFTAEELKQVPLAFTLGEKSTGSQLGKWFTGGVVKMATRAGTEPLTVPGKHFSYVMYPEATAKIIYELDARTR